MVRIGLGSGDGGQIVATVAPDPSLPVPEPPTWETCWRPAWPEYALILFLDPLFALQADAGSSVEPYIFLGGRLGADYSKFQVRAVPPGHYRALAAEHLLNQVFFGRPNDLGDDDRMLWSALAALGQPVTVCAEARVEIVLPDKTIGVVRLAARLGVPLDSALLNARF